jgi:hypothetical protein
MLPRPVLDIDTSPDRAGGEPVEWLWEVGSLRVPDCRPLAHPADLRDLSNPGEPLTRHRARLPPLTDEPFTGGDKFKAIIESDDFES